MMTDADVRRTFRTWADETAALGTQLSRQARTPSDRLKAQALGQAVILATHLFEEGWLAEVDLEAPEPVDGTIVRADKEDAP